MRLTDFSDFSLRVLIHLNRSKNSSTLQELSERLNISRNTLIHVSNRLSKLGYVEAQRGRQGGIKIKKGTGDLSVASIIANTEENFHIAGCFSGGLHSCTLLEGCGLKKCLHEALTAFQQSLAKYSLNDIS